MSHNLLHKSKLSAFKDWLDERGIEHRPGRGDFQILQVALPGRQWGVVYDRIEAPEHYTVTSPMERLVRAFIRDARGVQSCRKCGGMMKPGKAIEQTYSSGLPDFPGDTHGTTISPAGPGRLVDCLKCERCGWSVTAGVDLSEQGRNRSAVLGNTMQALTEGGVPFVQALEATLKALDHPTVPHDVAGTSTGEGEKNG